MPPRSSPCDASQVFVETFRMESVRRAIRNVTSPEGCPPASTFPTGPGEDFSGIRGPFFKAAKQECQYVLQRVRRPLQLPASPFCHASPLCLLCLS